jgi:translation elongation factor EF-Tu-like GTPase
MDDEKRDQLLLEILDRLARLETKFDEQVDVKQTARAALDKANDNSKEIIELKRRMDENDNKWRTDRTEKWGMWIAIVAGIFTVVSTVISALIK